MPRRNADCDADRVIIIVADRIRAIPIPMYNENFSPRRAELIDTAVTGSNAPSNAAIVAPAYFIE